MGTSAGTAALRYGQHTKYPWSKDFESAHWQGCDVTTPGTREVKLLANEVIQCASHHSLVFVSESDVIMCELYQDSSDDHKCDWVWEKLTSTDFDQRKVDLKLREFEVGTVSTSIKTLKEYCNKVSFLRQRYSATTNNCQNFAKEVIGEYEKALPNVPTVETLSVRLHYAIIVSASAVAAAGAGVACSMGAGPAVGVGLVLVATAVPLADGADAVASYAGREGIDQVHTTSLLAD